MNEVGALRVFSSWMSASTDVNIRKQRANRLFWKVRDDQEVPGRVIGACVFYYTHKPEKQYNKQQIALMLLIKLVKQFHTI